MAAASYAQALAALLVHEGGYSNHPADPGGPTNWGITLADARRYWKGDAAADDVRRMPQSVARKIYRERYWNALRCDDLPAGVDYAVFDYGVNSGVGRAGKVLRRVLGLPDNTSAVTDAVIGAANNADAVRTVSAICAERMAFLKRLKTFGVFGRGWTRRVASVEAAALAMARNEAVRNAPSTSLDASTGKAVVPVEKGRAKAGVTATVATGIAVGLSFDRPAIWLLSAVAVVIVIVVGGLIWRWHHRRAQEAAVVYPDTKGPSHGLG
jgi:lysozyme family protein